MQQTVELEADNWGSRKVDHAGGEQRRCGGGFCLPRRLNPAYIQICTNNHRNKAEANRPIEVWSRLAETKVGEICDRSGGVIPTSEHEMLSTHYHNPPCTRRPKTCVDPSNRRRAIGTHFFSKVRTYGDPLNRKAYCSTITNRYMCGWSIRFGPKASTDYNCGELVEAVNRRQVRPSASSVAAAQG